MHYNPPTILRKVNVLWNPRTKRWRVRDGKTDKVLYELRRVWLNEVRFYGVNAYMEGRLVSLLAPKEPPFQSRVVKKSKKHPYFAFADTDEPIVAAGQAWCGAANLVHVPRR